MFALFFLGRYVCFGLALDIRLLTLKSGQWTLHWPLDINSGHWTLEVGLWALET